MNLKLKADKAIYIWSEEPIAVWGLNYRESRTWKPLFFWRSVLTHSTLRPELSYLNHQLQLTNSSHLSISANPKIHGLLMQLWLEQVPLPWKLGKTFHGYFLLLTVNFAFDCWIWVGRNVVSTCIWYKYPEWCFQNGQNITSRGGASDI